VGKKEKLKFGRSQATSGFDKVLLTSRLERNLTGPSGRRIWVETCKVGIVKALLNKVFSLRKNAMSRAEGETFMSVLSSDFKTEGFLDLEKKLSRY